MPNVFNMTAKQATRTHTVLVMLCIFIATLFISKISHAQTHATMKVVAEQSAPISDDAGDEGGGAPTSDDSDTCSNIDIDDFVLPLHNMRLPNADGSIFETVDLSLTLPALDYGPVEPPELV